MSIRNKALGISMLAAYALMGVGCNGLGEKVNDWGGLGGSEQIAVLPFKDHVSDDPKDSEGTGAICQRIMVAALREEAGIKAKLYAPADFDTKKLVTQEEAVAIGKQLGVAYVVYGDCIEYYSVAPFTFRPDRGGMRVWMVRVADGVLVYKGEDVQNADSNLDKPEDALEEIAEEIVEGMQD